MTCVERVLEALREKGSPDRLEGMARVGITLDERLGVKVPEMRKIAKQVGKDHSLALDLWRTGIAEARIVASMIDVPEAVTETQMEAWVRDFDSWDVCDQVCMNLFEGTEFAWRKIEEWSKREEEFVKRAAFALLACLAWHSKETGDEVFIQLVPLIHEGATDGRNYVKKAVSWALRNIGKRNLALNAVAVQTAEELRAMDSRSARWVGADVLRDITREKVLERLRDGEAKGQ
jgi:3-methyladenine DNA glycosylase AlkD